NDNPSYPLDLTAAIVRCKNRLRPLLPLSKCRNTLALAPSFEAYKFLRVALRGFTTTANYDATFSTDQARRGGDHNFTADGCCAGGSLAFRRATGRALACDPRRSTPKVTNGNRSSQRQRNQVINFVIARLVLRDSVLGVRLSFKPYWHCSHLLCVARNAHVLSGYVECVPAKRLQNLKNGYVRTVGRSGFEPLKA